MAKRKFSFLADEDEKYEQEYQKELAEEQKLAKKEADIKLTNKGKQGVSMISGDASPTVGEKNTYNILHWYEETPLEDRNPAKVTWELFKKRRDGKFTTTNIKKTGISSFTFGEVASQHTYRLEAYLHKPEGGGLIITPKSSKIPKIGKVELHYVDNKKGDTFSFYDTLRAKAHTTHLAGKEVIFTLWEDDAKDSGHDPKNLIVEAKTVRVSSDGLAIAEFQLTKALMKKAMKGEADAKELEFYITVEYYKGNIHDSENVNVKNPLYWTPGVVPPPLGTKKPERKATVKAKNSPAEQKPISKREEKNILIPQSKDYLQHDWAEVMGKALKNKERTVFKDYGNSTVGVKKIENKSEKDLCFCHKKFSENDVRKLVKMFKGSETIWEGQALKGGKRATCNIDDKSFTALTNALNSAFENYKIKTCAQKMHFLAQAITETGTFSSSEETASQHASSQSVYKGRGVLQITGTQDGSKLYNNPGPYEKYADYKVNHNIVKHPNIISNNINYCIDSGGWIWSHGKKMPEAPSGAVDRWGMETSGKSLNELAVFGDKYLELISVLLNGRGKDDMPNGWKERKANYNLLKTGFFKYGWYHNNNSKKLNVEDIITYHIYSEGRIERHIPKKIKSEYETKYRYIYHDKNNKEHIICIIDWLEIDKVKRSKPNPSSIPSGYISHESFNISGVNQKNVYKYSDGSVIASGKAGEGSSTIIIKYTKISGKEIIVKIPDPLNYSSENIKINLIFKDTIRKYMGRDHFACLIGALAECNFNQVISGGAAMKDGTCFPSVSHTNGTSIDIAYFSHANTQIFINAMIKFGFNYFLSGVGMNYIRPSNFNGTLEAGHSDHNHHLHTGAPNSLNIKITEIKE